MVVVQCCCRASGSPEPTMLGLLQMLGPSRAAHHYAEFQPGERPGWLLDGDTFAAKATMAASAAHLSSHEKAGAQHLLPPTDSLNKARSEARLLAGSQSAVELPEDSSVQWIVIYCRQLFLLTGETN